MGFGGLRRISPEKRRCIQPEKQFRAQLESSRYASARWLFESWRTSRGADSDDVNGLFRRDVNKSERSDAGICNDAGNYSHESTVCLFLAGRGVWGEGTAFEFP